jgi:hypothetical protein
LNLVAGYCPMGCGGSLYLSAGGTVLCGRPGCPNPRSVAELLSDAETEHIVEFDAGTFQLQHPLRERLGGLLFACTLHRRLPAMPAVVHGRYRAIERPPGSGDFDWTELS